MGVETFPPDPKRPWESKTFWVSAILAVVPAVFPPAAAFIAANPALVSAGLAAVFSVLRLVSHGKVTLSD